MTTDVGWKFASAPQEVPESLTRGLSFPRAAAGMDGDLQEFTDDLAAWLAQHPARVCEYAPAGAWMAYRVAVRMATSGFEELSLHYFELALDLDPGAPPVLVNHAVALHALRREHEAIAQYEAALPHLDEELDANVFLLLATLQARNGNPKRAAELLEACAPVLLDNEALFDLWGELEEPADALGDCRECGEALSPGARFCRACGHPVAAPRAVPRADTCAGCGGPLSKGARFCRSCGRPCVGGES